MDRESVYIEGAFSAVCLHVTPLRRECSGHADDARGLFSGSSHRATPVELTSIGRWLGILSSGYDHKHQYVFVSAALSISCAK
jgi:hypothetical protein